MTTDNFCFHLQNRLIQTSQTGGQWYSDTYPFSIPWIGTSQYKTWLKRFDRDKRSSLFASRIGGDERDHLTRLERDVTTLESFAGNFGNVLEGATTFSTTTLNSTTLGIVATV
jgi:hypothetical protein